MSSADQRLVFDSEIADFAAAETCAPHQTRAYSPERTAERRRAQARFGKFAGICAAVADFLTGSAGVLACTTIFEMHAAGARAEGSLESIATLSLLAGLLVVLLSRSSRDDTGSGSLLQIRETERALRSWTIAMLLLVPLSFLLRLHVSILAALNALVAVPTLLILEKQAMGWAIRATQRRKFEGGRGRDARSFDRVVVYGGGAPARRVVSALLDSPQLGLRPVAVIDDGCGPPAGWPAGWMVALGYRGRASVPVHRGPETSGPETETLLEECACDVLVIASENPTTESAARITHAAKQMGMRVAHLAGAGAPEWQLAECTHVDGLLLTSSAEVEPTLHYATAKRAMDLILASGTLVVLAPMYVAIALWIRLDSPGHALFRQKRVGRGGRIFQILKFRTMDSSAAKYDESPADPADARITRAGRFLRRTSLDELPQLFNVLKGDMSLVGPRPEMPFLVDRHFQEHQPRLQVLPGITGLWQLSADRNFRIHENLHYDLYYIRNRTFFLDAAVLIHTLFFAMHGV
jgi:exopolysaccharide biosynthesis polyprenyl glycosylphosphotransferase